MRVANDRYAYPTATIQHDPDLPVNLARYFAQRTCEFRRDQLFRSAPPSGEPLQFAKRLGLEAFRIPVERNELQPFNAKQGVWSPIQGDCSAFQERNKTGLT